MKDEIEGAKEYAINALEYQRSRPALADLYYKMAQVEMNHFTALHEQTVQIIEELKQQKNNIPEGMLKKWEEKHREMIICQQEAQTYINLYR